MEVDTNAYSSPDHQGGAYYKMFTGVKFVTIFLLQIMSGQIHISYKKKNCKVFSSFLVFGTALCTCFLIDLIIHCNFIV